jgi:hypothetical protein
MVIVFGQLLQLIKNLYYLLFMTKLSGHKSSVYGPNMVHELSTTLVKNV